MIDFCLYFDFISLIDCDLKQRFEGLIFCAKACKSLKVDSIDLWKIGEKDKNDNKTKKTKISKMGFGGLGRPNFMFETKYDVW